MADNEDQSSTDESADQTPTPEELQAAELAKTRQALLVSAAMQQSEAQLPNALPTRAAPIAPPPPPMTSTQPPPVAPVAPPPPPGAPPQQPPGAPGYEFGRGIGVLRPPAAPPPPQPRMYMGPASGPALNSFSAGQGPSNVNLMPPPAAMAPQAQAAMQSRLAAATGGESDPAALSRLQAADAPGSRTISVRSESPYSDASLANQRNAMLYNAMKKFDAGDRSPEVMAAAMGSAAPKMMSADQRAALEERIRHNKVTEAGKPPSELVTKTVGGKTYQLRNGQWVHVPDVRNTMDTETQTLSPTGQVMETKRTRHSPVQAPATKTPAVGEVRNGYQFKGGDPSKKENWEKI